MKREVQSVVDFVKRLLAKRSVEKADNFAGCFENVLCSHYQDHWFPEKPFKGSGYRCMRIVNRKMDPLIARAGAEAGYSERDLLSTLPTELTLWVDPEEVSYRIGEEGSIGVLFPDESQSSSSDSDSDSSAGGSLSSSPAPQEYALNAFQHYGHYVQQQPMAMAMPRTYSPLQDPQMFDHWSEFLSTFVAS